MRKFLKTLLILVFLSKALSASSLYINLVDFMMITAKSNKVRIVADESIDTATYHFIYEDKDDLSISEFKSILSTKGLFLIKQDNLYIVSDKNKVKDDTIKSITLNNISSSVLNPILGLYDINGTFISNTNTILFKTNSEIFNDINKSAAALDISPESATFKLVITETNLNEIKDRGADLTSILKPINRGDLSLFINLLTSPYMSNSNIINSDNSKAYYSVINFLDTNGLTKIISSPFLTAFNDSEVSFSSVKNIPYLTNTSETTNTGTSSTSSYSYKDVGLKISLKPNFLNGGIRLDLHLVLEDLMTNSNNLTPSTSKKELKSSYFLKRGEVLVLSGINKSVNQTRRNGVPLLKDIWLLKYLFSVEQSEVEDSILTLSIEAI